MSVRELYERKVEIKHLLDDLGWTSRELTLNEFARFIQELEGIARTYGLPVETFKEQPFFDNYHAGAMLFKDQVLYPEIPMRQILPQDFAPLQNWWTAPETRHIVQENSVIVFHKLLIQNYTVSDQFRPLSDRYLIQFQVRDRLQPVLNLILYPHPRTPALLIGDLPQAILLRENEELRVMLLQNTQRQHTITPIGVTFTRHPYEIESTEAPQTEIAQARELQRTVENMVGVVIPEGVVTQPVIQSLADRVSDLERRVKDLEEQHQASPRVKALVDHLQEEEQKKEEE